MTGDTGDWDISPPPTTLHHEIETAPLPYAVPTELPGTPYRLEEVLGRGGFGAVYRASSAGGSDSAVKLCLDPEYLASLRQERKNLERLTRAESGCWHIVHLIEANLDHATPYLVYEYIEGGDLRQRVERCRPGADAILGLVRQIAAALAFAHRQGLVHRDLKPGNILVTREGTLKLADFGVGRAARAGASGEQSATRTHFASSTASRLFQYAGTPLYMSPEHRRGDAPDPRHDVYSLGVLWYQLLAGDVTREMSPAWQRELERASAPPAQVEVICRCVGPLAGRPRDGTAVLAELESLASRAAGEPLPPGESRRRLLRDTFAKLGAKALDYEPLSRSARIGWYLISAGVVPGLLGLLAILPSLVQRHGAGPQAFVALELLVPGVLVGLTALVAPLALWQRWRTLDRRHCEAERQRDEALEHLERQVPEAITGVTEEMLCCPAVVRMLAADVWLRSADAVADWRWLLGRALLRLTARRLSRGWFSLEGWLELIRRPSPLVRNPAQVLRERFAEEVRTWGGPAVLSDVAAVRRLVGETSGKERDANAPR